MMNKGRWKSQIAVDGALFYLENHVFILRKYKWSSQLKGDTLANEVVEMAFHKHSYHCNSAYWLVSIYSKRAWLGTRAGVIYEWQSEEGLYYMILKFEKEER